MSVEISDVPKWLIDQGISHVLMRGSPDDWKFTACQSMRSGGIMADKPGKRKCRKCIAALANLVPMKKASVRMGIGVDLCQAWCPEIREEL